jgi:5-methylcytosine-specific restriction endonuclease McrA
MTPQDDDYPNVIAQAIERTLTEGVASGRAALTDIAYPVQEMPARPGVPKALAAHVYLRDHFICRYCGGRTILTAVMEVLATLYGDIFPFHRHWKAGLTHPAILTRSAAIDHVVPGAWGGDWLAESNLVTACWPCNARKGDLTLAQLGWRKLEVNSSAWDGLTGAYPKLWDAAGRPNPRLHLDWMRCLGLQPPSPL